jgi:hypothetical protein
MYNDDTDCLSSVFLFTFFSILSPDWLHAVIMNKMQKTKGIISGCLTKLSNDTLKENYYSLGKRYLL